MLLNTASSAFRALIRGSRRRKAASSRRRNRSLRTASAAVEHLEDRTLLSAGPFLATDGGAGVERVYDMTRDADGNTIVSGSFEGTVTFGAGEANETTLSGPNKEGYVAKYAADGTFLWAQSQVGLTQISGSAERTRGVAVDSSGNVYVTGEMRGDLDADGDGSAEIAFQSDDYENFVVKYDSDGNLVQAFNLPGTSLDRKIEVTDDAILVTGFFWNGDFDPDPNADFTMDATTSGRAFFLAKYDLSGDFVTATQFGSLRKDDTFFGDYDALWDTAVDGAGSIYITGRLDATQLAGADFDGDGVADTPTGSRNDGFLVKYDSNGDFQWLQDIDSDGLSSGFDIAVDDTASDSSQWSVYLAGSFTGSASIGSLSLNSPTGDTDAFVATFDAATGTVEAGQTFGGSDSDYATGITFASDGRIYLGGSFRDTIEFGNQTLTSNGGDDGFIAELDANLAPVDVHQISSAGQIASRKLHVDYDDASDLLYAGADFAGETTFPSGETATPNGLYDIFVAAFDFSLGGISGRVFADLDQDGANDDGMSIPGGFTLDLYQDANADGLLDGGDVLLATRQASQGSGSYSFGNLDAGSYLVTQTAASGWTPTTDTVSAITLGADAGGNVNSGTVDFGNYHPYDVAVYDAPPEMIDFNIKDNWWYRTYFTINESLTILDLDVAVDITHSRLDDLTIELEGPADASGNSTKIMLFDVPSTDADLTGTIFDDEATTSILAGSAPYTGSFQPIGSLQAFDQQNTQGEWSLYVTDNVKNREQGTLNSWSLTVTYLTEPPDDHDVAVTSVSAPGSVEIGNDFTVDTVVKNEGLNAETFDVTLVNSTTSETVQTWTVTLNAGASQTLSAVISSANMAAGDYAFTATAQTVTGETDTADNTGSTTVTLKAKKGGGGKGGGKPGNLTAETVGHSPVDNLLTQADAEAFAQLALQLWTDAGYVDALPPLEVAVADLPGNVLGSTSGNVITLDTDAAGMGWFIDATPGDDSEFDPALGDSPALQHYDLLTAVAHEVGHALGFEHGDDSADVMAEALSIGTRRLPADETSYEESPPLADGNSAYVFDTGTSSADDDDVEPAIVPVFEPVDTADTALLEEASGGDGGATNEFALNPDDDAEPDTRDALFADYDGNLADALLTV